MMEGFEGGPEKILTKQEILDFITKYIEGWEVVDERSDEKGVYLLNVKVEVEDEPGKFVQYEYLRKGHFPNKNETSETHLEIVYYQDEEVYFADEIAFYDEATGEWRYVE